MQTGQILCHRCSSVVPEGSLFCTECGAPQLVLTETDAQRIAEERGAATNGSAPPPQSSVRGRIRWRPVLRIVAGFAVVTGALMGLGGFAPAFGLVAWFLVIASPMLTLNLYQRRVPGAPMDASVGARIGLAVGVLVGFMVVAASSAVQVIYRYPLHQGAKLDDQLNQVLQKMMTYPSFAANPAETAQFFHTFQTPDGRAGMALGGGATMACLVLVYCVFSGALRGWVRPNKAGVKG